MRVGVWVCVSEYKYMYVCVCEWVMCVPQLQTQLLTMQGQW